jgi:hypothetical protein
VSGDQVTANRAGSKNGVRPWDVWASQIRKVFPPAEFPIVDVPIDHPMFRTLFQVQKLPQIPSTRLARLAVDCPA